MLAQESQLFQGEWLLWMAMHHAMAIRVPDSHVLDWVHQRLSLVARDGPPMMHFNEAFSMGP